MNDNAAGEKEAVRKVAFVVKQLRPNEGPLAPPRDYAITHIQGDSNEQVTVTAASDKNFSEPLLALFGLRKLSSNSVLSLVAGQRPDSRNRRRWIIDKIHGCYTGAGDAVKIAGKSPSWQNEAFGNFKRLFEEKPTRDSQKITLIETLEPDDITFWHHDPEHRRLRSGERSSSTGKQKTGEKSIEMEIDKLKPMSPDEVKEMVSRILQDRVVAEVDNNGTLQSFKCLLRRNLNYAITLYDEPPEDMNFPQTVVNYFKGQDALFMRKELYFYRGVGDLGKAFSVLLLGGGEDSNSALHGAAALPDVIYREEFHSNAPLPKNPDDICQWESEKEVPLKLIARMGRQIPTNLEEPLSEEEIVLNTIKLSDIEHPQDEVAYKLRYSIPVEFRYSFEPVLFSFQSFSVIPRNNAVIPFSLSEETLGVRFIVDYSDCSSLTNPHLDVAVRIMPGPNAPRPTEIYNKENGQIGMEFDAHSLDAGTGAFLSWPTLEPKQKTAKGPEPEVDDQPLLAN